MDLRVGFLPFVGECNLGHGTFQGVLEWQQETLSSQHILKTVSKSVRVPGLLSSGNAPVISFRDSTIFFLLLELKAFRTSLPTCDTGMGITLS